MSSFIKNISVVLFLLLSAKSHAQIDSILLNNGIQAKIKVIDISGNFVKYTIPGDAAETVYSIDKREVKKLWLNSDIRLMSTSSSRQGSKVRPEPLKDFKRNYLGFNMTQMVYNSVSFEYERIFGDGIFSAGAFYSGNFAPQDMRGYVNAYTDRIYWIDVNFSPKYRTFTVGANFKVFPYRQQKVSWYILNNIQGGNFNYRFEKSYNNWWPPQPAEYIYGTGIYYSYLFGTGVKWRITPAFFVDAHVGGGINRHIFGSKGEFIDGRTSCQVLVGYSF